MKKAGIIIIGVILLSFLIGIYFYPQMPERLASHWNAKGEVDGYMPKFWGLFLMPFISLVLFLFFILIPKIDPLKANIEKFRNYYNWFIALIVLFFFYIYILTIVWNLGIRFDMMQFLVPVFGILFYYSGVLIEHAKQNWFIGIRTPWTLSNERVWEKTHKLGGKLFKILGVIAVFGVFFPRYTLLFIVVLTILVVLYTAVYSYIEYKKIKAGKRA